MRVIASIEVIHDDGTPIWHASKSVQIPFRSDDLQANALRGIEEVRRVVGENLAEVEQTAKYDIRTVPEHQP